MTMVNGNVLVIGNSGVGKSTLINAVLGEDVAIATLGKHDDEQKLEIYSNENAPFNIIDSIGFEPGFLKDRHAVKAIKEWAAKGIKKDLENNQINAIWFCIDGTSSKLFDKTIKNFIKATDALKGIPVIVVITKSYSKPDRDLNIQMIEDAFSESKKCKVL